MNLKLALHDRLLRNLWRSTRTLIEGAVAPGCGGIAFLGDSITHLGKWDLLFPGVATLNFGIGGERSEHLLARLDPIVAARPSKLFVLIGTNDLGCNLPPDAIAANVDALLEQLRLRLPECTVWLQGVMPRARRYVARIRALNARYAGIAARRGVAFIDLFPLFDDGTGQMRADLSDDCLHLNGAGYLAWREVLRPMCS